MAELIAAGTAAVLGAAGAWALLRQAEGRRPLPLPVPARRRPRSR